VTPSVLTQRRRAIAAVAGVVGCLAATPGRAEVPGAAPPAAEFPDPKVEEAREAFRVGSALAKQGQWGDALAAFERSARLRPHAVTTYNIGFCERALRRLTRARKTFERALEGRGELGADLTVETQGYLGEIESRLARAMTTLSPPGARVAVDGRPLEAGFPARPERVAGTRDSGPPEAVGAGSFTMVLDPGPHVIVVSAPGVPDAVVTRDMAPGATVTLTLAAAPVLSPTRRLVAGVAFGVGSAAAVTGVVFGVLALRSKSELASSCPARNQCALSATGTIGAMRAFANVSTAGVTIGLAGLGAGTAVLLTGDRPTKEPSPVTPALLIGPGRLVLRGSF
jgi:hypothetical protein